MYGKVVVVILVIGNLTVERESKIRGREEEGTGVGVAHILRCLRTLMARALTASCAGPGRVFLICSL